MINPEPTLDIVETTSQIQRLRSFVDWERLTLQQKWIISEIVNFQKTRREIAECWMKKFGEPIGQAALNTAIIRSSLSRPWTRGMTGGTDPYLCDEDFDIHKTEITE